MTTFTSPAPVIKRAADGRPYIIPPDGGKPKLYSRWSSYGDVLEDTFRLSLWSQRMVAEGLSQRPDLILSVSAHLGDRNHVDDVCEQAKEYAKASAKATTGTALHTLSELVDDGEVLPELTSEVLADLDAYRVTMADSGLKVLASEQFVVHDEVGAAGTFDRIVEYQGQRYIADLKTGRIDYGIGKIAVQLAGYSRSLAYDAGTGERTGLDVDQNNGLIIHLPSGEARCELVWVNLTEGWAGVELAQAVRAYRRNVKRFTAPFAA